MLTTANLKLKKPEGTDVVNIEDLNYNADVIDTEITKKVDKVSGKGLSTNDFTTTYKNKLDGIATNANNYVHPGSGTNPHGTTKSDVGLGSVNNWGASAAVNNSSDTTYATAGAVKKAYDKGVEALNSANGKQSTSDSTLTTTAKTIVGAINELASKVNSPTGMIKSIQRGIVDYDSNGGSIAISPVDLSKSILIVNSMTYANYTDATKYAGTRAYLESNKIYFSGGYRHCTQIAWQVIEFY